MSAISVLNPKAEIARASHALAINISAAKGLQEILKSNLGPKGTMKMLVSGAGEIKITKDGNVLLHEMQIQHPTASLIARTATAQDDVTGDGTTSSVLIIAELLKQADNYIAEGLHPRIIVEGFDLAKEKALEVLEKVKIPYISNNREMLVQVARSSLETKLTPDLSEHLNTIIVDAVLAIAEEGKPIDLFMIEIMEMLHKTETDTQLVKGIVMDHGARHPDMPKHVKNAYILTANISLEYEKTEVNSGFFYKSAEEREKLISAERAFTDDKVKKIIEFKKKVCPDSSDKTFVLINQKGIDPVSLDLLAAEGIIGLRRAKRRNMERLTLACGGYAVNATEDLVQESLGFAQDVYEHVLGEDKYTFVEGCANPKSVTILIKAPNKHTMIQIKDAIKDALRAVINVIEDKFVVPGAGAFEIAVNDALQTFKETVKGKARLGVAAFAEAFLTIPKTLAQNAGHDQQSVLVELHDAFVATKKLVGVDLKTGGALYPMEHGIIDNYRVKRQIVHSATIIASNLLLVDEIMRAGLSSLKSQG
jgi:T-complex protein 1 subunit zeta